ncbi:MAG: hypothetical protein H5T97_07050, partial [Firmicutes bacterium]|nr:hypothetical protein [Bacillota bacterium]
GREGAEGPGTAAGVGAGRRPVLLAPGTPLPRSLVDRPEFPAWAAAVGGPNPEDFRCASTPRPIKSDITPAHAAWLLDSYREHVKTATSPDGRWFVAWTLLEEPDQYVFLWNRTGRDEVERVDTVGSGGQYHLAIRE